jgi:hypothetical protein
LVFRKPETRKPENRGQQTENRRQQTQNRGPGSGFYKRQCQKKTLFPTRRGETVLVIEPLSPMMIVRFGKIGENRGQGKSGTGKIGDRRDVHLLFRKGPVKGFGIRRKDELAAVAALRNMMRNIDCYHTS